MQQHCRAVEDGADDEDEVDQHQREGDDSQEAGERRDSEIPYEEDHRGILGEEGKDRKDRMYKEMGAGRRKKGPAGLDKTKTEDKPAGLEGEENKDKPVGLDGDVTKDKPAELDGDEIEDVPEGLDVDEPAG